MCVAVQGNEKTPYPSTSRRLPRRTTGTGHTYFTQLPITGFSGIINFPLALLLSGVISAVSLYLAPPGTLLKSGQEQSFLIMWSYKVLESYAYVGRIRGEYNSIGGQ